MARIDVQAIKNRHGVMAVLEARGHDLKKTGGYFVGPCPFCGGHDRFTVKTNESLWHCRGCATEGYKDVIDLIKRLENLDFKSACSFLEGDALPIINNQAPPSPKTPPATAYEPPAEQWRSTVERVACEAATYLQDLYRRRKSAAVWLEKRGIDQTTAAAFTLGYLPKERWVEGLRFEAGLSIPHVVGLDMWALKIRRTSAAMQADIAKGRKPIKYTLVRGGTTQTLFNANALDGAEWAIVTEGELDAVLLSRFVDKSVAVVTAGSASTLPHEWWKRYLFHLKDLFVVMDSDGPGKEGAKRWAKRVGWGKPAAVLPEGNDLTDYWQAGGDLREWANRSLGSLIG